MFRDESKHGIASEKRCLEVESALGDVGVGEGDVQSVSAEVAKKVTQGHPVLKPCVMDRKILKKLANHGAPIRRISTSKEL